jgi:hypothetical protein
MSVIGLSLIAVRAQVMTITLAKLENYHARLAEKQTLIIGASRGRKENKR